MTNSRATEDPSASTRPLPIGDARADRWSLAIRESPLHVGLVDLEHARLLALSPAAHALLGERRDLGALVEQSTEALRAVHLVADGAIGGYQARRRFIDASGEPFEAEVWLQALDDGVPRKYALFVLSLRNRDGAELGSTCPLPQHLGPMALGSMDRDSSIELISSDVENLLGYRSKELIGAPFSRIVHRDDRPRVASAQVMAETDATGVCLHVTMATAVGGWRLVHLLLAPLLAEGPHRFSFILGTSAAPWEQAPETRMVELERHLWRIALEVQSAGVARRTPESAVAGTRAAFAELSARQWEIVQRLLAGERVSSIARAMYLSPSTVRNHLSAVFRKFGVHSQAELIERLRQAEHD